jgi:hypothetical protein
MSRRTPPRKLNLGDLVPGPVSVNQRQGIAALFAVTFDLRVTRSNEQLLMIGGVYSYMANARGCAFVIGLSDE